MKLNLIKNIYNTTMVISAEYATAAANLMGKKILDHVPNGRQALLLSDQTYLERYTLGSINRDLNRKWVEKMKDEMMKLILSGEKTTFVVCIDVREIKLAVDEQQGATDFKGIIHDGQHRLTALKEIYAKHPTIKYDFWVQLYIVQNEMEMEQLIMDLDRRLPISTKDKNTIQLRRVFIDAFLQYIDESNRSRRCVTGTLTHKVLREKVVVDALSSFTSSQLSVRIRMIADQSKSAYEEKNLNKTSALAKAIEDTKMYQLIDWESGSWIYRALGIDK